jgi:hypothetical protein
VPARKWPLGCSKILLLGDPHPLTHMVVEVKCHLQLMQPPLQPAHSRELCPADGRPEQKLWQGINLGGWVGVANRSSSSSSEQVATAPQAHLLTSTRNHLYRAQPDITMTCLRLPSEDLLCPAGCPPS